MKRSFVWPMLWLFSLLLFACGSDPLNHLPGMNPWLDGNPTEFTAFATAADEGPW